MITSDVRVNMKQFLCNFSFQFQLAPQRVDTSDNLSSWGSWDDGGPAEIVIGGQKRPETVSDHIQAYRDSLQEARRQADTG